MIGKIYIITEKETGQIIYVGSTKRVRLSLRMCIHYHDWFVKKVNHTLAKYIRSKCSNLQEYHEKFEHQIIREYIVSDLQNLRKIEERWRKHFKPLCNEIRAYLSKEELDKYYKDYKKKYYAAKKNNLDV